MAHTHACLYANTHGQRCRRTHIMFSGSSAHSNKIQTRVIPANQSLPDGQLKCFSPHFSLTETYLISWESDKNSSSTAGRNSISIVREVYTGSDATTLNTHTHTHTHTRTHTHTHTHTHTQMDELVKQGHART